MSVFLTIASMALKYSGTTTRNDTDPDVLIPAPYQ